jgi:hypothetical protein
LSDINEDTTTEDENGSDIEHRRFLSMEAFDYNNNPLEIYIENNESAIVSNPQIEWIGPSCYEGSFCFIGENISKNNLYNSIKIKKKNAFINNTNE